MILDRFIGILLLAVAIGAIWHAQSLVVPFAADPVGPKAFPTIVGIILALSGASLLLRPDRIEWETGDHFRVLVIAASALVYPLLLLPLGFVTATSLLCFLAATAFRGRPLASALSAVILSFAFLVIIDVLLGLPLPRGPLGI